MSRREVLGVLIPALSTGASFCNSPSWVITLRTRMECWSLHTPVVSDPETGSLSSKPFMAIMLTWYSTPGVSFTKRVSVSVPSTITMEGAPGNQQSKIREGDYITLTHHGQIQLRDEMISLCNLTFLTCSPLLPPSGMKDKTLLFI